MPDSNLIISPGSFYRTRDGRKAFVGFINNGIAVGFIIAARSNYDCWWVKNWRTAENYDGPQDLIAPWIDAPVVPWEQYPAWFQWVAMDEGGGWFVYETKPDQVKDRWTTDDGYVPVPPEYSPTFTGDWRDSLVMRPEGGTK